MRALSLIAALTLAAPALADELWTTAAGQIVYEADRNDYVGELSIPATAWDPNASPGARITLHVMGLAGNTADRYGMFEGYWTSNSGLQSCDPAVVGAQGKPTQDWGRIQVYFDTPAFPSAFTLLMGSCFYDPFFAIRAEPYME